MGELSCSASGRRLCSDSRRLEETIEFAYRIEVVTASAASTLAETLAAADPAAVEAAIRSHLPDGSTFNFTVTRISARAVTVTITTTSTVTAGEELDDSHASRPMSLGPVAMALIAASLMVFQ